MALAEPYGSITNAKSEQLPYTCPSDSYAIAYLTPSSSGCQVTDGFFTETFGFNSVEQRGRIYVVGGEQITGTGQIFVYEFLNPTP